MPMKVAVAGRDAGTRERLKCRAHVGRYWLRIFAMASWPFFSAQARGLAQGSAIGFRGIGAASEEQPHQLLAAPSACPSERRAFQDVIAEIEASAGIERGGGEGHAFLIGDVIAGGDDLVQDGGAVAQRSVRRARAFENHLEDFEIARAVPFRMAPRTDPVIPESERREQKTVPPRIAVRQVRCAREPCEKSPHRRRARTRRSVAPRPFPCRSRRREAACRRVSRASLRARSGRR